MMKINFISGVIAIGLSLCSNATPLLELEAKELFMPEKMNDSSVLMTGEYIDFKNRMNACEDGELRSSVETFVVNAITSIVVSVSTNHVENHIGMDILRSRTEYFKKLHFKSISTLSCVALANYLKDVQPLECSSNLVSARLNMHRYRFEVVTNSAGEVKQVLKKINDRKIDIEKRRQVHNYYANKDIVEFRKLIFSICGQSISESRKKMNDEVFSDFTNKVVRLSNASLDEQKVLFWRLNLGEQAEIYDARQRDALLKEGE